MRSPSGTPLQAGRRVSLRPRGLAGRVLAARPWLALSALVLMGPALWAQEAAPPREVQYTLSFPEPGRRYVQVEAVFPAEPGTPVEIRMSRTSPGRYALHEFAKNVFDETAADGRGRPLAVRRSGQHAWIVDGHDGAVRFSYRVYGDTVDGTYLAIDETHAHMNVPATLVWAPGLERHPVRVTLVQPRGRSWSVATQLFPTDDPLVFTAPNLWYLIDSPIEFGDTHLQEFAVAVRDDGPRTTIRLALHHDGSREQARGFLRDIERIVVEERAIFGELPAFDPGHYTFIADYLPWADGDGMEHRNSTILTSSATLANAATELLATVAHEFFHCWNVERIRPRSLEPFDLTATSAAEELWLAEGFTSYYGPLALQRSGLVSQDQMLQELSGMLNFVTHAPGRKRRSAATMSQLAPFNDGARAADRTALSNTFLSYYPFGAVIGFGLDLTLRDRSDGRVSLDDYMRELWRRFGAPGGPAPGLVGGPYTMDDLVGVLGEIAGSRQFAEDFFRRYVTGTELPDFERLLDRAGMRMRRSNAGRAWTGALALDGTGSGVRVRSLPVEGTPAWNAGLAQDDVIRRAAGAPIASPSAWHDLLATHLPGEVIALEIDRRGRRLSLEIALAEDPTLEIVRIERTGLALAPAQETFRRAWLDSKVGVAAVRR